MSFKVRFTPEAEADLIRLYEFILERDATDLHLAEGALTALQQGIRTLEVTPFTCRKAKANDPFLRELIVPFGSRGYVALFEIENPNWVTVLAVRHQREEDYH